MITSTGKAKRFLEQKAVDDARDHIVIEYETSSTNDAAVNR